MSKLLSRCFSRRTFLSASLAATVTATAAIPATGFCAENNYPKNQPITLVVGYPPGGGVDSVTRLLARQLEESLGQTVVVENRPGAGSIIGTNTVTRAKPDGYTLLVADPALIINPSLMASVPYVYDRDLVPVSMITKSPLALAVPVSSPIKTLADLIKAGKDGSKLLNFASAGLGTTPHMAGELLKLKTSSNFTHIPYKGSGPAMTDLISGQVDFAFATLPATTQYLSQERLRGLAVTSSERSKFLPKIPTVAETLPGFEVYFWTGLFAPAGTPAPILETLNAAVKKALESDTMKSSLVRTGETGSYMPLADTKQFVNNESVMWAKVIKDGNIKVD